MNDTKKGLPLPPGFPQQQERGLFILALVLAEGFSLGCLLRFWDARQSCYARWGSRLILRSDAMMPPFFELVGGAMTGFVAAAVCMAALALWHWHYYYEGSRSIDLMRRLPQRGLLLRQVLTAPLVLAAVVLLAGLATLALYALIYRVFSPPLCIPPRPWALTMGG